MDSAGIREAEKVGPDELQTIQVLICGAEDKADVLVGFSIAGTMIATITEKPVKSIGEVFDTLGTQHPSDQPALNWRTS